ncbi:hypothetical protein K458DRAFT_282360, partial [Lentithecium fluviatile CBS 122367]
FYSPANYDFYSKRPYLPLDKSKRSIRLLKVIHHDDAGYFRCELTDEIPLPDAHGTYTAVSYCAGNPKNTRAIEVNGIKFNAFANLVIALDETLHYRAKAYGDEEPLLWLDQVCINQSDPTERSHQVGFMRDIYSSAWEVAVCLSTSKTKSRAMSWIEHVGTRVPGLEAVFKRASNSVFVNGCNDVLKMLGQPWWTRAWIFQEYTVSQSAHFIYGGQFMHGRMFSAILLHFMLTIREAKYHHIFLENNPQYISGGPEHRQMIRLSEIRSSLHESIEAAKFILKSKEIQTRLESFNQLLSHSRRCGVSDPRDRVYAFVGLVDPMYGIVPDYDAANTAQRVFSETARRIILHEGNLSILSHAVLCRGDMGSTLPSWVPDWTSKDSVAKQQLRESLIRHGNFDASRGTRMDASFSGGCKVLEITGIFVDNIVDVRMDLSRSSTSKGYRARTGPEVLPDDQIWILSGARLPLVLRSIQGG